MSENQEERDESLLTPRQREFIRGEFDYDGEYASQKRYQLRKSIETRLGNLGADLQLIANNWEEVSKASSGGQIIDFEVSMESLQKMSRRDLIIDEEQVTAAIEGLETYRKLIQGRDDD